jgi:hypothetical protein
MDIINFEGKVHSSIVEMKYNYDDKGAF